MSIFTTGPVRLIVQGITGKEGLFHATKCAEFGTTVVGGVTPGKAGESVNGWPVFSSVREAKAATKTNATMIFNHRIDADYKQPHGGFAPVKVTYVWEENGAEKRDVHIARSPAEEYALTCAANPAMKSIVLERAD